MQCIFFTLSRKATCMTFDRDASHHAEVLRWSDAYDVDVFQQSEVALQGGLGHLAHIGLPWCLTLLRDRTCWMYRCHTDRMTPRSRPKGHRDEDWLTGHGISPHCWAP